MSTSSDEDEPELETLNISNDEYYRAPAEREERKQYHLQQQRIRDESRIKCLHDIQTTNNGFSNVPIYGSKTIRHSLAAYDLWRPFFPTYLSEDKFRNFHRPRLRHYNTGPQALLRSNGTNLSREFPIKNLSRNIYKEQKRLKFKITNAIRCGLSRDTITNKLLLIERSKDLSAKWGEIILFEYCEEHPPVLSQIGMASNIKNYSLTNTHVKPRPSETTTLTDSNQALIVNQSQNQNRPSQNPAKGGPTLANGICEKISSDSSAKKIYFSQPKPGATFKMIENNLYRAPIYEHEISSCDFLIIRTRNNLYIRPVKIVFTVGQTMPLVAIPPPTEASIMKFRCDLSNMYIHKLFKESDTQQASIKLDKLAKLFPDYHINTLKRRLIMNGAVPLNTLKSGHEHIILRGKSSYGLVTHFELRKLFLPEHYCLHMASLAARQRLRELNYSESMISPANEVELEIEVLAAPWNTSKAILNALHGRHYLDLKRHLIDPTGARREGFSCVAWSRSPTEEKQANEMKSNSRAPTGEPYVYQDKNPLAQKIRNEKLERMSIYRNEASLITTVQARVLSSDELISSSEEEDNDHDDDENNIDRDTAQQLRDLDKLVVGCRSIGQLNDENEEEERRKLLAEMRVNGSVSHDNGAQANSSNMPLHRSHQVQLHGSDVNSSQSSSAVKLAPALRNKILMITRTYKTSDGEIRRTEIVREPGVIALYVKQKGGSLNSSQTAPTNGDNVTIGGGGGGSGGGSRYSLENSIKGGDGTQSHRMRSSSRTSLGPSELCRADGLTLTISKKVLQNIRPSRRHRQSMVNYNCNE